MSGDGLRETCCPDLWDRINELESQLTEAKAVSDRWQKDCRWYQEQYADCATELKEAKATIAKQQALMERVANERGRFATWARGERCVVEAIDDMIKHLKEKQNA